MPRLFLPIILSLFLLAGGTYYYLTEVKAVSLDWFSINKSATTPQIDSTNLGPISFTFNSEEPILGNGFGEMRDNLLSKLGPTDTLVIYGKFFVNEQGGELMGYGRAQNVQTLFSDYIDLTRLKVETLYDNITEANPEDILEAVQFNVVAAENSEEFAGIPEDDFNESDIPDVEPENTLPDPKPQPQPQKSVSSANVLFADGSVKKIISTEANIALDNVVTKAKANVNLKIYVTAYCDDIGTDDYNFELGRKRAWAVKKLLWDKGVDPGRIITDSKGRSNPISQTDKAVNRRVEVIIK